MYVNTAEVNKRLSPHSPDLQATMSLDAAAFNAKYVSTNVPPGAPLFDGSHFRKIISELSLEPSLATSVVTGVLCALKRGDLVAPLFTHLVDDAGRDPQEVFAAMRMAITTTLVFSGAPQVVPACLGLSGAMKARGLVPAESTERLVDSPPSFLTPKNSQSYIVAR
jgi:hypothetical protein